MRTKKGESYDLRSQYFDYSINGVYFWVQGDIYYNEKKKRFEHIHYGKRGGETLIFWTKREFQL